MKNITTIEFINKSIVSIFDVSIIKALSLYAKSKHQFNKENNMETRKEIAAEKKRCGSHNCTQAVLCTYHDFTGMEEENIKNAGNAFAAGMGNMDGTCGALVGAGIVLGLATKDKAKSIKGMRQIMDKFKQRNGATQCKLLKGVGTGKVLRECPLCVADASEFLEEILEKEGCWK